MHIELLRNSTNRGNSAGIQDILANTKKKHENLAKSEECKSARKTSIHLNYIALSAVDSNAEKFTDLLVNLAKNDNASKFC